MRNRGKGARCDSKSTWIKKIECSERLPSFVRWYQLRPVRTIADIDSAIENFSHQPYAAGYGRRTRHQRPRRGTTKSRDLIVLTDGFTNLHAKLIGELASRYRLPSIFAEVRALRPRCVVLDTVSDVFLGDEIKRDQVRQFGTLLRKLAIDGNCAVVCSSHPSLTGLKSGSGLSGSTQWHNSVRARAYFRRPKANGDDEDETEQSDNELRELEFLKNSYGPLGKNDLWIDNPNAQSS